MKLQLIALALTLAPVLFVGMVLGGGGVGWMLIRMFVRKKRRF